MPMEVDETRKYIPENLNNKIDKICREILRETITAFFVYASKSATPWISNFMQFLKVLK